MVSNHEPAWVLNEGNGRNYCGYCGLSEEAHAIFYEEVEEEFDDDEWR